MWQSSSQQLQRAGGRRQRWPMPWKSVGQRNRGDTDCGPPYLQAGGEVGGRERSRDVCVLEHREVALCCSHQSLASLLDLSQGEEIECSRRPHRAQPPLCHGIGLAMSWGPGAAQRGSAPSPTTLAAAFSACPCALCSCTGSGLHHWSLRKGRQEPPAPGLVPVAYSPNCSALGTQEPSSTPAPCVHTLLKPVLPSRLP